MKFTTLILLSFLILTSNYGQDKSISREFDKKKRELAGFQPIDGKGILISYPSMEVRSQYDYTVWTNLSFYDYDLNEIWTLEGLNKYTVSGSDQAMKVYSMLKGLPTVISVSDNSETVYLHNFIENEVTSISVSEGKSKTIASSIVIPEDYGYIDYSTDENKFIVSFITYTNKKTETENFETKLYVARYDEELNEDVQEVDVKSVGSSKHKVRFISSSSPTSRKWKIIGGSSESILLQDSYILHDDQEDQNYRRLMSINNQGESKEVLIPYGDYDKKSERYFGETFCNENTNDKLYNVCVTEQDDKTGKVLIQILDLDLTLLTETTINTDVKASKFGTSLELESRGHEYGEIIVWADKGLYRIVVDDDYSEIVFEQTDPKPYDCIKGNKYQLECYDYENYTKEFKDLSSFVAEDMNNTKDKVNIQFYKHEDQLFVVKTPQVSLGIPDCFIEIYKFHQ